MRSGSFLVALALVVPLPALSATIHVPAGQPTIQAGINIAISGDTVLVAAGTYTGPGNRDLDFHGNGIVVMSSDGPAQTIIDCQSAGRGFHLHSGETRASVIRGFTVRNGLRSIESGGGISCENASPLIANCWISSCTAENGGGIQLEQSAARIENCTISNCFAQGFGGGLLIDLASRVDIVGCSIFQNRAFSFSGGGIFVDGAGVISLSNCIVGSNLAGAELGDGGGVSCSGAALRLTMTDCEVSNNIQTSIGLDPYGIARGGGVFAEVDSVTLIRCTFQENAARSINNDASNDASGGGACLLSAHTTLEGCDFVNNECEARSLVTEGGYGRARGGGLFCQSATLTNCRFEGNTAISNGGRFGNAASGGGVHGDNVDLYGCIFARNGVIAGPPNPYEAFGGGCALMAGSEVTASTFAENWATTRGSALDFRGSGAAQIHKTIIAFSELAGAVSCGGVALTIGCTDVFGNNGGDWVGCIAWQAGMHSNFSGNPVFCDPFAVDLTLAANSPCAPAHSPGQCGLVGALPVSCSAIGVADAGVAPVGIKLRVIPNPVRSAARFELGAITPGAMLSIFDSQGRLVEQLSSKEGHWEWAPGVMVPAGVYFARPEAGPAGSEAVKFLYLR